MAQQLQPGDPGHRAVTLEERAQQVSDRKAYQAKIRRHPEDERERLRQQLSVADRLMMRRSSPRFKTVFSDELGDFVVESRILVPSERARVAALNELLKDVVEKPGAYDEAMKGFRELAASIATTEGIGEWLLDPESPADDVAVAIVMRSFNGTIALVGNSLTSFRAE